MAVVRIGADGHYSLGDITDSTSERPGMKQSSISIGDIILRIFIVTTLFGIAYISIKMGESCKGTEYYLIYIGVAAQCGCPALVLLIGTIINIYKRLKGEDGDK